MSDTNQAKKLRARLDQTPGVSLAVKKANPHLFPELAAMSELPAERLAKATTRQASSPASTPQSPKSTKDSGKKPHRAKEPNRTEREFEAQLRTEFPKATIRWEAYRLKLAPLATYEPDYSVAHENGTVEFFEVKGPYVFPKALAKLRVAAVMFPQHKFTLAQKKKIGWERTELPNK